MRPWSAEDPALYRLSSSLLDPHGRGPRGRWPQRIGFRHVEVRDRQLLVNGQPVLHPRGQPPRPRPAHRARPSRSRTSRRRPGAHEAVQPQRGARARTTRTTSTSTTCATSSASTWSTRPTSRATPWIFALCHDPRYRRTMRRARDAHGPPRQEPPVDHRVVARQRERVRRRRTTPWRRWIRRYDPTRPLHYEGADHGRPVAPTRR